MHPLLARRRAAVGREAGRRRLVILLGALSLVSVVVIAYAALHSSLFSARHVTIVGNHQTTDQQILDASGMLAHPALLNIDVARDEATIWSQSRDGPADGDFDVKISTVSAEDSWVSSGTSRPFTRAPMQRWPTSVWMA